MAGRYPLLRSHGGADLGSTLSSFRLSSALSLILFTAISFLLFYATSRGFIPTTSQVLTSEPPQTTLSEDTLQRCASTQPLPATPPALNLWSSLTVNETERIWTWLESPDQNLNLTRANVADVSDNLIFLIETYHPPKAESLAYLASPSTVSPPKRFARVTIHHGADPVPSVKNYLVGPLPIGPQTRMKQLTEIYHRNDIPYNARGIVTISEIRDFLLRVMPPYAEAIESLFGGAVAGLPNDTLTVTMNAPFGFDGTFRRSWISWKRRVPGFWLLPVDFYQYIDMTGTDVSKWSILKVVYNQQIFSSTDTFLEAFRNGTLIRAPRHNAEEDLSWTTRKRVGPKRDLDHLPGPRSVSFAGLRFRLDKEQQYISWMGWCMYLGFDRDMGLSLWDVRLNSERIIYQLAPQEALAQYAGNDPIQASTAWLDRSFGMGENVWDLLPGYDCPHEAVYLPATTVSPFGSITRDHAICIFEQDTARPLTRHTGYGHGEFGAVKGYVLTIRSITTVGNYDYLFDYIFHLDGTIEVRVSSSGYLQGGYWGPTQSAYGTRIGDTSMGTLHDHVMNYKVDLDVAGVENSLLRTSTNQVEVQHPWFDDDWGQTQIQQKISREYIMNEDDALLKFAPNFQGIYAIVNKAKSNRWGTPRGYAIHPGYSPIHNTVVGSKRLLNNANWARYNMAVSRRKETEPASSSMWNVHLPGAPVVDFHKFFDGENITQEDLVAWVNIGMHHITQSEDSPNTRTNTATSSFFITPFNYFDADISMQSSNAILLSTPANAGEAFPFDDYGVRQVDCIPEPLAPFEYAPKIKFGGVEGNPIPLGSSRGMGMPHRMMLAL